MLLLITSSVCGTADAVLHFCQQKNADVFRLNMDLYHHYEFLWNSDGFEIIDPKGRSISSHEIDQCAIYKSYFPPEEYGEFDRLVGSEAQWVKSNLNYVSAGLAVWAMTHGKLRLWTPSEFCFTKMRQMELAKSFFTVPDFSIHWGFSMKSEDVVAKTLIQKKFSDGRFAYATIVDREQLDVNYPWFLQKKAKGNRDATVLYINGKVHCFEFAEKRVDLTDWRVTQGTNRNKWQNWKTGKHFKNKVDAYMKKIGLKFGRLDFIIGGREPEFLEVNPCGQFGWLDDENLTLHNEVADAILDPASTIDI